jgi:transposase
LAAKTPRPSRPPDDDPHRCGWRDWAEHLEKRMTDVEARMAALEQRLLGHQSEKLPPVADEVREKRDRDPAKTREPRQQRAQIKAQLIEEQIQQRVPEAERQCPKCGNTQLRRAGEKTSTVYEYVPGYFRRQQHVRETLSCSCGEYIVTAPAPDKSTDKTHYGPGFIAHLLTAKCCDSIPLYRLEKQYARIGIPIARSTMTDLFHRNAELLSPLSNRLLDLVRGLPVVQADETSLRRLDVKKRGFLWTFLGALEPEGESVAARHVIAYAFSPDRSGTTPSRVLGSSTGTLVVDAYARMVPSALPARCGKQEPARGRGSVQGIRSISASDSPRVIALSTTCPGGPYLAIVGAAGVGLVKSEGRERRGAFRDHLSDAASETAVLKWCTRQAANPSESLAIPGQVTANLLDPAIYQNHRPDVSAVDVSDAVPGRARHRVTMRRLAVQPIHRKSHTRSTRIGIRGWRNCTELAECKVWSSSQSTANVIVSHVRDQLITVSSRK